ncbi:MAG: c-type cytochrome [Labilithrix sp.]|nr:c-type cytochrome [Labilithrix sp.]MCW5815127.1 c-type cytochrome [Labilithrix sp.]
MKRALSLALVLAAACTKKSPPPPPPVEAEASAPAPVTIDARGVAERSCLSCHTMQMLEQQRLTEAQWKKVVTKMATWGANLEPSEEPALVAWLAASFGPDAGAYVFPLRSESAALDAVAATPDGRYAAPDAGLDHARALYTDRCSGCHGPEARGHIGTNLVDRPFLYRAEELARTIRKGRGKMPPMQLADAEIAEILTYLRSLR